MGNGPESRWTSFSTAKSITATLVGAALHDGAIGSLDDRLRAIPAAAARLGLRGRHDSQSPADVLRRGLARGERCRRTLRGLSPGQGHGEPAARLRPRSPVQTAARSAAGRRLQLFDRRELPDWRAGRGRHGPAPGRLLRRDDLGTCRHGGRRVLATRSEGGLELGGFGVSARLRDFGRFGQLVLEDGEAFSGRRVLPPGWRDLAGQPDSAATAFGRLMPGSPAGYGYHWWAVPPLPGGVNNGAFSASGAYRPVHLRQSGRAGGRCNPERVASASRQRRRARNRRDDQSCGARAANGAGVVGQHEQDNRSTSVGRKSQHFKFPLTEGFSMHVQRPTRYCVPEAL